MSNTMTSGANALKLENEVISEAETSSDLVDAHVLNTEDTGINHKIETTEMENPQPAMDEIKAETSNGLENFGIEEETPDLFSSNEDNKIHEITSSEDEDVNEDDDFEIPAFTETKKLMVFEKKICVPLYYRKSICITRYC